MKDVADRAGAVVALRLEAAVSAAPDVGPAVDLVSRLDRARHRVGSAGGDARLAAGEDHGDVGRWRGGPTGAPGTGVVVVVAVVVPLWPAAGLAAISAPASSAAANPILRPWRDGRDSKEIPPPVPS